MFTGAVAFVGVVTVALVAVIAPYRRALSPNLAWKNQHMLGRWSSAAAIATGLRSVAPCDPVRT